MSVVLVVLLAGFVSAPSAAGAQQDREEPVVEAARQVTTDVNPTRAYALPQLAVHPEDPSVAAIAVAGARNGGCSLHVTADGGRSWAAAIPDMLPDEMDYCVGAAPGAYLDLTFASDGTLYVAFFGAASDQGHPDGPQWGYVVRTDDLGATFERTEFAAPEDWTYEPEDGPSEDGWLVVRHPRVAVHPDDPDQVYVTYRFRGQGAPSASFRDVPDRTHVTASDDGGNTWSEPTDLADMVEDDTGEEGVRTGVGPVAVSSDGTAHVVLGGPDDNFFLAQSTDDGASWQLSEIGDGEAGDGGDPVLAIDHAADNLYLVWHQRRGGDEDENVAAHVYLFRSTDGGQTWDERMNLTGDEGPARSNHYHPGVSVAPNGRVDVVWYDYRHSVGLDPDAGEDTMGTRKTETRWDAYLTSSHDHGETWQPGIRVTDRSIDAETGVTFANYDLIGPIGLAATDQSTLVAWGDTRAGADPAEAEDTYFTQVRHPGPSAGGSAVQASGLANGGLLWSGLGAGVALAVAGLILLIAMRTSRQSQRVHSSSS